MCVQNENSVVAKRNMVLIVTEAAHLKTASLLKALSNKNKKSPINKTNDNLEKLTWNIISRKRKIDRFFYTEIECNILVCGFKKKNNAKVHTMNLF